MHLVCRQPLCSHTSSDPKPHKRADSEPDSAPYRPAHEQQRTDADPLGAAATAGRDDEPGQLERSDSSALGV